MKNLSYIANEINKGKDLEDNLKLYLKSSSSIYSTLGAIKLSMNYYTLVDILLEQDTDDKFISVFEKVKEVIEEVITTRNIKQCADKLEKIRHELVDIMEKVTGVVDRLRVYEYVLNRIEYKYRDGELDSKYYNTYLTNEVMHYILSDKDNVVINTKIAEIVGQLPIRMSKGKFFDYIEDAFGLYHGAMKSSIDDFYYALSTTAMLNELGDISDLGDVGVALGKLENTKYEDLSKDKYEELKMTLDYATSKINDIADGYVLITQIVNDALTICFSIDYALGNNEELELAKNIILDTGKAYINRAGINEIADRFVRFEGKQEKLLDNISNSDFIIDYVNKELSDRLNEEEKKGYDDLLKVTKLQSGSDFVTLFDDKKESEIPDNSYADNMANKLCIQLDESFKNMETLVKRAVMAAILSNLPVFFNNTEELQDYINSSLMACSDTAEQMAVIELIKSVVKQ